MTDQSADPTMTTPPNPFTGEDSDRGGGKRASDAAGEVAHTARGAASNVAHEAKEQGLELVDEARSQVRSQAESQTHRASQYAREISDELATIAEHSDTHHLTPLARDGAARLQRLSTRLDERGIEGALDDVKRFARRRPGMFLAGCFGAGFVLGRIFHNADRDGIKQAVSDEGGATDDGDGGGGDGGRYAQPTLPGDTGLTGHGRHAGDIGAERSAR